MLLEALDAEELYTYGFFEILKYAGGRMARIHCVLTGVYIIERKSEG